MNMERRAPALVLQRSGLSSLISRPLYSPPFSSLTFSLSPKEMPYLGQHFLVYKVIVQLSLTHGLVSPEKGVCV